jgi:hypothetical protein
MVSNYEQITRENIRRRGEDFDDIGKFVAEQLYSDRTHFIYELLQNTEDALRRRVREQPDSPLPKSVTFRLYSDRLEVSHFGQPFNEDNVQAICDVLRGTSRDDDDQIGHFGIGFKSVYAFTSFPEIYSEGEHFRIERYIRPCEVEKRKLSEGETLFIFPFDPSKQNNFKPDNIFDTLRKRLHSLNPRTLLFLRHLEEISWSNEQHNISGTYRRETQIISSNCRKVTLIGGVAGKEEWLVFEKSVTSNSNLKVEVAFLLREQIAPVNGSPLVVFLPTEIETELQFLVQGPYRTTPARDNILRDEPFNQELIEQTATLVAEVLPQIREMRLLTVSFLNVLPICESNFQKNSLFLPVFEKVREAFRQEALLPTSKGTYTLAKQAKLARSAALRRLLSDIQLQQLYGDSYTWLSDDISENTTPELCRYIKNILEIEELEPEKFVSKFTLNFIEKQSDEWVTKLYAFLKNQEALWKQEAFRKNPPLLNKPFIRLQNCKHVTPFTDNRPNAYFPSNIKTSFSTIKFEVIKDLDAKIFLERLGLSKPSTYTEVRDRIVRMYKSSGFNPHNYTNYERDIKLILEALESSSNKERKELIELLHETPFLLASNSSTGYKAYKCPKEIYFRSQELEFYFEGNKDAWFIDDIPPIDDSLLAELGVKSEIRLYHKHKHREYVIISDFRGNYERGKDGFDPKFSIDGLEYALNNPTLEKAIYIWKFLLLPNLQQLKGVVEFSKYKTYQQSSNKSKVSIACQLLREKNWLPKNGYDNQFYLPCEICLDELSQDFIKDKKDEALAELLQIQPSKTLKEEAERVGIEPELLDFLRKNPGIQKRWLERLKGESSERNGKSGTSKAVNYTKSEAELPQIDYAAAFKEAFSRPGITGAAEAVPLAPITNPERRRSKIEHEIRQQKEEEPLCVERFKKIKTTKWEGKNTEEVRGSLKQWYNGKCQICAQTFLKRTGESYFEGVYIVSYTQARWIDRVGNVLCLCSTCCAKFQHGSVDAAEDILEQIYSAQIHNGKAKLQIILCGEETCVRFDERHIIELQELLNVAFLKGGHN